MIEELFYIEKQGYRQSIVHDIDARVKIIICFSAIIAMVAVPYSSLVFRVGAAFFVYFAFFWAASRLSPFLYLRRLLGILPFGIFLAFAQIFFTNRYYTTFTPMLILPFGITIYAESVEFAFILMVKFIVSVSFIILLSSTTKIKDLLEGAGRLGLPAEFTLTLGMMVRYLFVFGYMYRKINHALATRFFDPFDHNLPYRYRIRQMGNIIGTLFIRSYEQGERTYTSMLCRGYGRHSHIYLKKKALSYSDWGVLFAGLGVTIGISVLAWSGVFSQSRMVF
jgi:cobalt/nickel transport system permease protein